MWHAMLSTSLTGPWATTDDRREALMPRSDGGDHARRRSTVLVVADCPDVLLGVRVALEADGHRVVSAQDGCSALVAVAEHDPDAVVLDLAAPVPLLDGVAVCRTLRAVGDGVPVLLLSALDRPYDCVAGLDAGADDHLGKPFDVDELRARVRALLRRGHGSRDDRPGPAGPDPWPRWRGVALDERGRRLVREGTPRTRLDSPASVELTRIEAGLAGMLFRDPGRVRTREELVDVVWADRPPASNALDVAVSSLRRKLSSLVQGPVDGPADRPVVRAVRGLGYRLEP
jgi:DNA-binding response OmpR family regulator